MLGEAEVAGGGGAELSVAGAEEGITHSMHHTHPLKVTIVKILCRTARSAAMMIIMMTMMMKLRTTFPSSLWSLSAGTHY